MKLPIISGKDTIKAFEKIGYKVVRQKGSHIRLRDDSNPCHKPITIPNYKVLKAGLLRKLIKDANLSIEEFLLLVKDL
ncbi:MAG: type II toxin-antitoxin system HicA family toxin [Actinobacteria bacterium]|nr:type II toxin-antitoxin system HicA family toxin [Cyanobacteriota bacterium]MCL5771934.1 type II toxin-antitoxin system HicA family toxin [Actinomycetota bacterium]